MPFYVGSWYQLFPQPFISNSSVDQAYLLGPTSNWSNGILPSGGRLTVAHVLDTSTPNTALGRGP